MKIVSINSLKDSEEVVVSLFGLPYETLTVKDFKLSDMYNNIEDFKVVLKKNKDIKVNIKNSDMDKYKNLLSYIKKNRKIKAEELMLMEKSDEIDLSQLNAFHWEYIEDRKPIKDLQGNLVAEIVVRNTIKNIHRERSSINVDIVFGDFDDDNDDVYEEDLYEDDLDYILDEIEGAFENNGEHYYTIEVIKEIEFNVINNHEIIASDSIYQINEFYLDGIDSLCSFLNGDLGDIKVTMGVEANSKERVIEDIANKNISYIWDE